MGLLRDRQPHCQTVPGNIQAPSAAQIYQIFASKSGCADCDR